MLPKLYYTDGDKRANQGQQGINKTKALHRKKMLFLEMGKVVEDLLNNCILSELTTLPKPKLTIKSIPLPPRV